MKFDELGRWLIRKVAHPIYYVLRRGLPSLELEYSRRNFAEKAELSGKGSFVDGGVEVVNFRGLALGENVYLEKGVYIDARGGVLIGDNTHIGRNTSICSVRNDFSGSRSFGGNLIPQRVIIGEDVEVGMNVCIVPGVKIGRGAIIGMGVTVSKDVEAGAIISAGEMIVAGRRNLGVLHQNDGFDPAGEQALPQQSGESNLPELVFVVSTGRSGSKAVAETFAQHSKVNGLHEPLYDYLKHLSFDYLSGALSREYVEQELSEVWSNMSFNRSYGHIVISDQKLVPFISIIADIFPKAKFIWILREPRGFVKSAAARGWYKGDDPLLRDKKVLIQAGYISEGTRITGDIVGDFSSDDWLKMSQVQRLLWYWKYWNELIEKEFQSLDNDRVMQVFLKDFNGSCRDIVDFVGIIDEAGSIRPLQSNKVWSSHKKRYEEQEESVELEFEQNREMIAETFDRWKEKQ